MDVVYVCRDGKNEELRYSLRSLQNFPHNNVWVVGGAPDWYSGNLIKTNQTKSKYDNAHNNVRAICSSRKISKSFVLMNDDFFIVKPIEKIPYMYSRPFREFLEDYKKWAGNNRRVTIMSEVLETLISLGIQEPLDYELHVPMVFEKQKLAKILPLGYAIRSIYGNYYNVGGVKTKDVKYHTYLRGGPEPYDYIKLKSPFLSTSDRTFWQIEKNVLQKMFPDPSPYE